MAAWLLPRRLGFTFFLFLVCFSGFGFRGLYGLQMLIELMRVEGAGGTCREFRPFRVGVVRGLEFRVSKLLVSSMEYAFFVAAVWLLSTFRY